METIQLKTYLTEITDNVTEQTTVEEVFNQLKLLLDIEQSEWQEKEGLVYSHEDVKLEAEQWLK